MNRRKFLSFLGAAPVAAPVALAAMSGAPADALALGEAAAARGPAAARQPLFDVNAWHRTPLTADMMSRRLFADQYSDSGMYMGVEFSAYNNFCAIAGIRLFNDGILDVWVHQYLRSDADLFQDPEAGPMIRHLADMGHIMVPFSPGIVHEYMVEEVKGSCEGVDVKAVACDPHQAHNTLRHLYDEGLPVAALPVSRKTLSRATLDLRDRICDGRLSRVRRDLALDWNIENTYGLYGEDGSVLAVKESPASPRSIAGVHAIIMANALRLADEDRVANDSA